MNRITPTEAAALIESEIGLKFTSKRVLYLSRNRSADFPALTTAANPKLLFFDRDEILAWVWHHFPEEDARLRSRRAVRAGK